MPVTAARKIAYDVLRRVEAEGAYATDILHTELGAGVRADDAALATEIALGVLRWRGLLDFLLQRALQKPVERLDLPVAIALRMGLYQLRLLERIPARAAVNESAELVKSARKSSAVSLVNAVLRRLAAEAKEPPEKFLPADLSLGERLSLLHSHPAWLVERWLARLGETQTASLLQANNETPRLACSLHHPDSRNEILESLRNSRLGIEPGHLLQSAFAVTGGSPTRTEAFRRGDISIQDEASQAIPLLLDVQAGDRVLDLCAAPGGKTPTLARRAGKDGLIVAADRHAHRLRAMREQFKRLHLSDVRIVELDAAAALPFGVEFDRILLDAPCSGTGTLARHPEIRWRLKPEQLCELDRLQVELLTSALNQLAPGGRLLYSTCSLEQEENEDVITEALRNSPAATRVPAGETAQCISPHLVDGVEAKNLVDEAGQFRTTPGAYQTDGFFAALLQKK
ncbi:MAG TPA: 16S rRNA (cytosine(967)-C(5))-methyltransferase RsmB [Candidatus Binatus sp.]|jgi:16S rRNA (cytosine967-C5)-methyltransferase|nr:16S rRNA (cytosine(967)-C(5))-methyltransferase RsmB [Candidatus Binatus sp.]